METLSSAPAHTSRRRTLFLVGSASLTALALVVFMVASVTRAAWTDTTDNPGNSWDTGTVLLTDDDAGVAMFSATNMIPGDVVTNDITVINESSVPLDVRLYGASLTSDPSDPVGTDLAAHLNLEIGTTLGGTDVYTGTLANFASTHTGFASGTPAIGLDILANTPADRQIYYFSVELDGAAPEGLQGTGATIDFVWEGQSQ